MFYVTIAYQMKIFSWYTTVQYLLCTIFYLQKPLYAYSTSLKPERQMSRIEIRLKISDDILYRCSNLYLIILEHELSNNFNSCFLRRKHNVILIIGTYKNFAFFGFNACTHRTFGPVKKKTSGFLEKLSQIYEERECVTYNYAIKHFMT